MLLFLIRDKSINKLVLQCQLNTAIERKSRKKNRKEIQVENMESNESQLDDNKHEEKYCQIWLK